MLKLTPKAADNFQNLLRTIEVAGMNAVAPVLAAKPAAPRP